MAQNTKLHIKLLNAFIFIFTVIYSNILTIHAEASEGTEARGSCSSVIFSGRASSPSSGQPKADLESMIQGAKEDRCTVFSLIGGLSNSCDTKVVPDYSFSKSREELPQGYNGPRYNSSSACLKQVADQACKGPMSKDKKINFYFGDHGGFSPENYSASRVADKSGNTVSPGNTEQEGDNCPKFAHFMFDICRGGAALKQVLGLAPSGDGPSMGKQSVEKLVYAYGKDHGSQQQVGIAENLKGALDCFNNPTSEDTTPCKRVSCGISASTGFEKSYADGTLAMTQQKFRKTNSKNPTLNETYRCALRNKKFFSTPDISSNLFLRNYKSQTKVYDTDVCRFNTDGSLQDVKKLVESVQPVLNKLDDNSELITKPSDLELNDDDEKLLNAQFQAMKDDLLASLKNLPSRFTGRFRPQLRQGKFPSKEKLLSLYEKLKKEKRRMEAKFERLEKMFLDKDQTEKVLRRIKKKREAYKQTFRRRRHSKRLSEIKKARRKIQRKYKSSDPSSDTLYKIYDYWLGQRVKKENEAYNNPITLNFYYGPRGDSSDSCEETGFPVDLETLKAEIATADNKAKIIEKYKGKECSNWVDDYNPMSDPKWRQKNDEVKKAEENVEFKAAFASKRARDKMSRGFRDLAKLSKVDQQMQNILGLLRLVEDGETTQVKKYLDMSRCEGAKPESSELNCG